MSRGAAATAAGAEAIGELLGEALHRLHAVQLDRGLAIMNESGLTVTQIVALNVLKCHGPQSVGALSRRVRLSAAATSHLVERLVRLRLATRHEHPQDRRQKRVFLSERGAALMGRLARARRETLTRAAALLSARTRTALGRVLGEVVSELEAAATPDDAAAAGTAAAANCTARARRATAVPHRRAVRKPSPPP